MSHDLIASSENRVVVGLGATGLSCARHLRRLGLPFVMVDTRSEPAGLEAFRQEFPSVELFAGEIPAGVIEAASECVVSPGVALDDPLVSAASDAGAQIIGDIDLFVREAKAPIVGITGSNAKSTVTELVGQMALAAGVNVGVGGNLGEPALDLLSDERQLYVLELSSFQLERAAALNLTVATVLNMSADHLDRHGDMPRYHLAKHRIFQGCETAVVNRDDPLSKPLVPDEVEIIRWGMSAPDIGGFGVRTEDGVEYLSWQFELLLPVTELGMAGRHNIANALASLAIGKGAGLPMPAMLDVLRHFSGLPHRCQFVAEHRGVRYIDDSKGTNVGATDAALRGLGSGKNIVLIAGGLGKGADFGPLVPAVEKYCKAVILIGEDAAQMYESFSASAKVVIAPSLEQAVELAEQQAVSGDCVLLSPACASFDMFSGYVQRGEAFQSAVHNLGGTRV